MGQKNAVTKRYYSDKIRFADLINGVYFQGQAVISADELTEGSEGYAEPQETDSTDANRDYLERTRDIKMLHQSGTSIRILAIENQQYVDYSMPLRNMQYDTLEYQHQLNEIKRRNEEKEAYTSANEWLSKIKKADRLHPVYTICLYLGEEPWDGPRSLKDMMDFGANIDGMSEFFSDYPFRLYCVNEQQDFSMFHTDIRNVFELLPLRKDKKKLLEKLEANVAYTRMDEDSLELLSALMDNPNIWKNRKKYLVQNNVNINISEQETREYNMCQAIRELIEDGRQEGLNEGRFEILVDMVKEGILKVEDAAKRMNISVDEFCQHI